MVIAIERNKSIVYNMMGLRMTICSMYGQVCSRQLYMLGFNSYH